MPANTLVILVLRRIRASTISSLLPVVSTVGGKKVAVVPPWWLQQLSIGPSLQLQWLQFQFQCLQQLSIVAPVASVASVAPVAVVRLSCGGSQGAVIRRSSGSSTSGCRSSGYSSCCSLFQWFQQLSFIIPVALARSCRSSFRFQVAVCLLSLFQNAVVAPVAVDDRLQPVQLS